MGIRYHRIRLTIRYQHAPRAEARNGLGVKEYIDRYHGDSQMNIKNKMELCKKERKQMCKLDC